MLFTRKPLERPTLENALPGRDTPLDVPKRHFVLGTPLAPPFPAGFEQSSSGWAASGRR